MLKKISNEPHAHTVVGKFNWHVPYFRRSQGIFGTFLCAVAAGLIALGLHATPLRTSVIFTFLLVVIFVARHFGATAAMVGTTLAAAVFSRFMNPNSFDRAAELDIDLTLAGDIHGGGQLSLDFIHRGLNLSSLMEVPYIRGLYKYRHAVRPVIGGSGGAQLYMNRGIGITGFLIWLGARPEITVLELTRET